MIEKVKKRKYNNFVELCCVQSAGNKCCVKTVAVELRSTDNLAEMTGVNKSKYRPHKRIKPLLIQGGRR